MDIIKLEHFFEADARIKREMYNNVPPSEYLDEEAICKYTDKLNDSLIYIFSELKSIALDLYGKDSNILKIIISMEKNVKQKFYSCGFDINKLQSFYHNYISDMSLEFINQIKAKCVGYTMFSGGTLPENTHTINELLHFIHSNVMNNENILQSIPIVSEKINTHKYPINLRGNSFKHFNELLEQFPSDLDVGWTDMVCINEKKMIMMVRDRGHALTIEITLDNNTARIEYFIPKLCNIEMINCLPGINKVNKDSIGATGSFETDIDNLADSLFTFISKVPTDEDMIFEPRRL